MKMYKTAAVIVFAATFASCKQNESGNESKQPGYETSRNGLQYRMLKDDPSPTAQVGNYVKFTTSLRTLNGDLLFSTGESNQYVYGLVAQPRHKGDPLEILQMMGAGDSASVIIAESEFFQGGAPLPPNVKKGDNIRMDLKMAEVFTAEKYNNEILPAINNARYAGETKQMTDYAAAQGWSAAQLPSGLMVVVDSKGTGTPVTDGSKVTVNYTGRLLNGTVFDSNQLPEFGHVQPFDFTVGKGMVIKGWDEGLKNFNKGGKGKLIIPARMGYGEQGSGKIPPNAPLVFEIEVVEVAPGA